MEQGSGWGWGGGGSWGQGKFFFKTDQQILHPLTHDLINESPLIPTDSGSVLN